MKVLKSITLFLFLFSSNAMVGTDQAIETYLDDVFHSIRSVSELSYLGQSDRCDEVVDVDVVGAISSRETAYSCTLCLINDGGIAVIDSLESICNRN